MAEQKVSVRIAAKDEASRTVEKVEGRFTRFGNFLKSRFVITLGDVTRLLGGMGRAFTGTIKAAQTQEDAVKKLDAALVNLGPAAEEVSKKLQEQAAALQKVSTAGDEAIIAAQAYLAEMGVQADKIPLATQATVDLAAALNISLESAARNVGKTVGGFAGELGEVIPELKNLSVEALRSGEGIALLADKFAGRAQAEAKTFSGSIKQIGNAFGDLREKLGEAITKNDAVRESLSKLATTLSSDRTAEQVGKLAEQIADATTATIEVISAIPDFVTGLGEIGTQAKASATEVPGLTTAIEGLNLALHGFTGAFFVDTIRELGKATNEQRKAERDLADQTLVLEGRQRGLIGTFSEILAQMRGTTEEQEKLTEATDNYTAARERSAALDKEYASTLEKVRQIAKQVGVELEQDVNAQLERNAAKLKEVELAAYAGIIAWEDYERIAKAMSGANEDLAESLDDVGARVEGASAAMDGYAQATERATVAQRGLRTQVDDTSRSMQSAAGPLFGGLSGKSYTYQTFTPATLDDLTYRDGAAFYRGREVRVLPNGRIEWA